MASDTGEWRSLEPLSLAVNLFPDLGRTLRAAWPLLLPVVFGGPMAGLANVPFLLLFFLMAVGRTFAHFLTLRYRVHEGKLEIRSGLLARQFRVIDPARIQNLEVTQNVFQKAAGLVELRVETAGGEAGIEGMLSAISEAEAMRLRGLLAPHAAGAPSSAAVETLYDIELAELVGYGVSAGRVGAAVLVVGIGLDFFGQLSPDWLQGAAEELRPGAVVGLLLFAMALGYATSVGGALLRYYGFRMTPAARGFALEAGLLTRRRVEIPVAKVQVVRVEEPWMRRLMGYGTVHVETAAVGLPGEPGAAEGVVPMVAAADLPVVTRLVLPRLDRDPWAAPLSPPAPAALARALFRGGVRWALWTGVASWALDTSLPLLAWPLGPALGWLDWRSQGWALTPAAILARQGFLRRQTWVLARDKVQSVHLKQGPLLRAAGLARVEVWVAGSSVALPDLREPDARAVFSALRAQQPAHREDARHDPAEVGDEPGGDGVARLRDAHRAEVDGQDVEGGVARAGDDGRELAHVGVGPGRLHDLAGDAEGGGPREGADQHDGQHVGGHAEGLGEGREGADEAGHAAARPEHPDRRK